jgi:phosphatidylinositol glycan class B
MDGTTETKDLTWEYQAKIRPALQPLLGYIVLKTCEFFSIINPYSQTIVLRLITAIISLLIIHFFTNSCRKFIAPEYWKIFLILSYFLWFFPFLNVRFSSENWSGLMLLLSVGMVLRKPKSNSTFLLIGVILGLSFLFRYQIAFAIAGLLAWLIVIKKEKTVSLILISSSFLLLVVLGIIIDSLFYGQWTVTTINYFIVNLIDGKAAGFGTSPIYYYFFMIFRYSFFPIGIIILISFLLVTIKKPKTIIVWIILPFIIGHSLISHKELRFLFPLINFIPILIIWSLEIIKSKDWHSLSKKVSIAFLTGILAVNMIALVVASLKPAGSGRVRITERIHRFNTESKLHIIYSANNNPYSPWGITTKYYNETNASFIELENYDLSASLSLDIKTVLVFTQEEISNPKIQYVIKNNNMHELGKSYPDFTLPVLSIYGHHMNDVLVLYGSK